MIATTLADSQSHNFLKPRPQDVAKVLAKAGMSADEFAREVGFPITQFTGAELYRLGNLERWSGRDGIRARFPHSGIQADSAGRSASAGEPPSQSDRLASGRATLDPNQLENLASGPADTPEFKTWFGASKVVNAQNKPLVVYHGTSSKTSFDQFSREFNATASGTAWFGDGFYFSPKLSDAQSYARPRDNVRSVFLKIENPAIGVSSTRHNVLGTNHAKNADGVFAYELNDEIDIPAAVIKKLKSGDFTLADVLPYSSTQTPSEYVVFKPTQIKSATSNRGPFDSNNPSILASASASELAEPTTNSSFVSIPDDATISSALSSDKKAFVGAHRGLAAGHPVGLRIDIPSFLRTGEYVVTVHERAKGGAVGKRIGYDGVATVDNPTFFSNETGARKIYDGQSNKFPVATVEGEFNPSREIPAEIQFPIN